MKIDIEFNSGAQLPMDAIPELAKLAEEHGFDCAWGGEANNKDPTVMLSAIATVTARLKIGSAIYHILGRTPATLALQAVGLDELSSGRFLLGIGSSNPTIAKWHGQTFDRPLGRVEEYVEIVQAAMRGEKLNFNGKYFTAQNFKMAFRPSGRKTPIYLAAFGSKMTRLAGRISDGVLINMANPIEIRRIAEEARRGAEEAGKDPSALEIICKIRCSIADSYERAREALSHALTYYALADYYRLCSCGLLQRPLDPHGFCRGSRKYTRSLEVGWVSCSAEVDHRSAFRRIACGCGHFSRRSRCTNQTLP
jgi:alkanesulfonate monooxygenase SsuD/methylene tetrahydromethanopterin reductase-like flavin-dependent oxidoreductase (luciferase family)